LAPHPLYPLLEKVEQNGNEGLALSYAEPFHYEVKGGITYQSNP